MNILCDFHHSDLWWSHHLIFEKGLGHKMYRPGGLQWHDEGYFNMPFLIAKQMLCDTLMPVPKARHFPNAKPIVEKWPDSLYVHGDTINGCPYYPPIRAISIEEFESMEFGAIMVTLSNNEEPFARLREEIKPKAKLIRESGNVYTPAIPPTFQNVITSDVDLYSKSKAKNKVLYHQRFDTENIFKYEPPTDFSTISCFMPGYRNVPDLMSFAEAHMKDLKYKFIDYGPLTNGRHLVTKSSLAEKMRGSAFVWNVKPRGDGFGHVVHNAFAMGRPIITVGSHYKGQAASKLMEDGITCVLIDETNVEENVKKIASYTEADIERMGIAAHRKFKEIDYDGELVSIKRFLENLA